MCLVQNIYKKKKCISKTLALASPQITNGRRWILTLLILRSRLSMTGLTHIRRNVLHWLDVTDRVRFRVCVQMFKCLHGMAPDYLSTMYHPASRLPGRQNLRSANRGQLDVPRATLSSCGVRAFAHAGPSLWNTLPFYLKNRKQLSCAILSLISFLSTDFVLSAFGVWSHKRAI